ncbi:uncharacterized protein LOC134275695 [Saccostrea cucullata]|uniref:uncharacterized protein LOC134275695 n=1 Tax=Saccostrea cuccullata TaxID=36930 RepID=UPI002ED0DA87
MDILILGSSKGGYMYHHILILTDHFTRFAHAIFTKNQTARTTAETLYTNVMTKYGFPNRIQGYIVNTELILREHSTQLRSPTGKPTSIIDNLSLLPKYKGQASMEPYVSFYNAPPGGAVDGYLQEERGQATSVNRHVGFSVFVFNDPLYIPPFNLSQHLVFTHNVSTCPDSVTTVKINKETQGAAIYNSKDPPVSTPCLYYEPTFATIEICKVKVMGCPSIHYGENCDLCNPKCRNIVCDAFNGSCVYGCSTNVIESPYCSGTLCNKTNGMCTEGCQDNWKNSKCNVCKNGFYGANCEFPCGKCRIRDLL